MTISNCSEQRESDNQLNVCPVAEDDMDDEEMDAKEEPSEESRVVRGGDKRG